MKLAIFGTKRTVLNRRVCVMEAAMRGGSSKHANHSLVSLGNGQPPPGFESYLNGSYIKH